MEKLWTYEEIRFNKKYGTIPYFSKTAMQRIISFMDFIGEKQDDSDRLRYDIDEVTKFLTSSKVSEKIGAFYETLDQGIKKKIQRENMEEEKIIDYYNENYSQHEIFTIADLLKCIKSSGIQNSADSFKYYDLLFKYKFENCKNLPSDNFQTEEDDFEFNTQSGLPFEDISNEVVSTSQSLNDIKFSNDLLDFLKTEHETPTAADIENWFYKNDISGHTVVFTLSDIANLANSGVVDNKKRDDLLNIVHYMEEKYDKSLLEKGYNLPSAKIEKLGISNITDAIRYCNDGKITIEQFNEWLKKNYSTNNSKINLLNLNLTLNNPVITDYLKDFTFPESNPSDTNADEFPAIEQNVAEPPKIEIVTPSTESHKEIIKLEIENHRKAISSIKRKKVVFASLAGVCALSSIIMTFATKTPAEIVEACTMFVDKVGIEEFKDRIGSPIKYAYYILSIVGIKFFGNMTAKQFVPEEKLESEINKLNQVLENASQDEENKKIR